MTPDRLRQVASVLEPAGAVRAHLPAAPGNEIESGVGLAPSARDASSSVSGRLRPVVVV